MWNSIVKPTLILFIVCVVISGSLAYVDGMTKDTIQTNTLAEQEEFRKQVLKEAGNFEPVEQAGIPEAVKGIYAGFTGNDPVGYVVEVSTKGYGGAINMTVGVNLEGAVRSDCRKQQRNPRFGIKSYRWRFYRSVQLHNNR